MRSPSLCFSFSPPAHGTVVWKSFRIYFLDSYYVLHHRALILLRVYVVKYWWYVVSTISFLIKWALYIAVFVWGPVLSINSCRSLQLDLCGTNITSVHKKHTAKINFNVTQVAHQYPCPYFPPMNYTITTFPHPVAHSTPQNSCDDKNLW